MDQHPIALSPDGLPDPGYPTDLTTDLPDDATLLAEYHARQAVVRQTYRENLSRCRHQYAAALNWVRVTDDAEFDRLLGDAANEVDNGSFWLSRVGRVAETDPGLTLALLAIRMKWVEELGATTLTERLLIDQALIALYHELRIHQFIGDVQARAEYDYFGTEPLRGVNTSAREGMPQFEVDEHLRTVHERLLPSLERCQRMLIRAIRELKTHRAPRPTIRHANQVNLAHQMLVTTPQES